MGSPVDSTAVLSDGESAPFGQPVVSDSALSVPVPDSIWPPGAAQTLAFESALEPGLVPEPVVEPVPARVCAEVSHAHV